jgi:hypothetical protein
MKIVRKPKPTEPEISFDNVKWLETFTFQGKLFMKIRGCNDQYNSVELENPWVIKTLCGSEKVIIKESTLTIED